MLAWNCIISYANLLFLNFHWICRDQTRSWAWHPTVLGEAATWRPIPEFSSCEEVKVVSFQKGFQKAIFKLEEGRRLVNMPIQNGMDGRQWVICNFVCEMDHEMEGPSKSPHVIEEYGHNVLAKRDARCAHVCYRWHLQLKPSSLILAFWRNVPLFSAKVNCWTRRFHCLSSVLDLFHLVNECGRLRKTPSICRFVVFFSHRKTLWWLRPHQFHRHFPPRVGLHPTNLVVGWSNLN